MRFGRALPVFSALILIGGAAACHNDPTGESDTPTYDVQAEAPQDDLYLSPSYPIYLKHPWVGRQVRLRDYTGDSYDRCLGPKAVPATNVLLQAELCYPSGLDALQWFEVVGVNYSGLVANPDPLQVSLRSVYNPAYCVDVAWGTSYGGEAIQLYPCHGGSNQRFHIPSPSSTGATTATGPVLTKNSNYTMAFEAGAPTSSGTVKPVVQRTYSSGVVMQRWTLQVR